MKKLFGIYTFQFDQDNGNIKAFNTTMVGEVDMSAKEYKGLSLKEAAWKRIKQELARSKNTGEIPLIDHVIGFEVFPIYYDKTSHVDTEIHTLLEPSFHRVKTWGTDRQTEMFDIGENYKTVVSDIINKLEKNEPCKQFIPREIQETAILKMYSAFKAGHKKFLLGAICRFGKTATLLYFFTEYMPVKNILVITAKCDAIQSWENDYRKFTSRDYQFLTKNDLLRNGKQFEEKNICVVSFQSAAKDYNDDDCDYEISVDKIETDTLGKKLKDIKWDVVIIDECHFGSETERSLNFLNVLKIGLTVDVSATPFKKMKKGEYDTENSFIYDLVDEKKLNEDEKDRSKYVPAVFYHLNFGAYGSDGLFNEGWSHSKIDEQLKKFNLCWKDDFTFDWQAYFNQFNKSQIAEHFEMLYHKTYSKTGKHYAIFINNIIHGQKLAAGLDDEKFEIVNVCGDSRFKLTEINEKLDKSKKPVIIISCGRDLTGVTLEKLDGLIIMGTLHSAENYFQFALRGKNAYIGRQTECSVYDLNPKSFIQTDVFAKYAEDRSSYLKTPLKQTAIEIGKCFEIFEINNYDNIEKCEDIDQLIHDAFNVSGSNEAGCYIENILTMYQHDLIHQLLEGLENFSIKKYKNNDIVITEDQTAGKVERSKREKTKNEQNNKITTATFNKAIQKIRELALIIPQFMFIKRIKHINEIIDSKDLQNSFMIWTTCEWSKTFQKIYEYLLQIHREDLWENINTIFNIAMN